MAAEARESGTAAEGAWAGERLEREAGEGRWRGIWETWRVPLGASASALRALEAAWCLKSARSSSLSSCLAAAFGSEVEEGSHMAIVSGWMKRATGESELHAQPEMASLCDLRVVGGAEWSQRVCPLKASEGR